MLERIRDWWERLAPRERRLASLLGITLGVCLLVWVTFLINDGLHNLAAHNDETRTALEDIEKHRDDLTAARTHTGEVTAMIPDEAQPLGLYLESIEQQTGVQIKNSTEKGSVPKGKFHELGLQIQLFDVSLDQLANFLKLVETKSPTVVTQRLYVKRSNNKKDSMDRVELTVATYERGKKEGGDKKAEKADAGEATP
jgi:hypothetical protein